MKLYGEIKKTIANDDGTLIVSGVCSSESVDSDGEIILSQAIADAIPAYMKFGAVREMHNRSACGTALSMMVVDDKTMFEALVVDPIAVKKINLGVYKGFSIGGKITRRNELNKNIIEALQLVEVSLVDRPANPESVFTMVKFDEAESVEPQNEPVENSATIINEEKPMAKELEVKEEVSKQEVVKQEEMPMNQEKQSNDPVMMMKEAYMHISKGIALLKECGLGGEEKTEQAPDQPKEEQTMAYSAKTELNKSESISKLENENKQLKEDLEKQNKEMENLLEETNKTIKSFESKGYLKAVAVSKSDDSNINKKEEVQPKTTIEALKKMYSQGGQPFGYNY